jgi:hypothetical protein
MTVGTYDTADETRHVPVETHRTADETHDMTVETYDMTVETYDTPEGRAGEWGGAGRGGAPLPGG